MHSQVRPALLVVLGRIALTVLTISAFFTAEFIALIIPANNFIAVNDAIQPVFMLAK